MGSVSGIDDIGSAECGGVMGGSGTGMSDDDGVGVHGLQVQDSVFEGFSFHSAAGIEIKVDDIRTQSFGGQLEGAPGARAGFKEEVDNCFSS